MYLTATCVASLVRCVLRSLAHFLDWVVFLLLGFKNSLYKCIEKREVPSFKRKAGKGRGSNGQGALTF